MKSFQLILAFLLISFFAKSQVSINANTYLTLKDAFDVINSGGFTGNILITLSGNTNETSTAILNGSGTFGANYSSIVIYPTVQGITVSGTILGGPIIDLNGADHVTIDGRLNGVGGTPSLTIINAANSNLAGTSTIRFINGARENEIKYCTIKGSTINTSSGVISFSTSTTQGNSLNRIEYCNLTRQAINRPSALIHSLGSNGFYNDSNTVDHTNFYNFLNSGVEAHGIFLSDNSANWIISNNSFYETNLNSILQLTHSDYFGVRINTNSKGSGFRIDNNYFGGSTAECGGLPFQTDSGAIMMTAIAVRTDTSFVNSIQGNLISNISFNNNTNTDMFVGIDCGLGKYEIGNVVGNTIGSTSQTSVIYLESISQTQSYGIRMIGCIGANVQNNSIGGIECTSTIATNSPHSFCGIYASNNFSLIKNNIIGSLTTPLSIQCLSSANTNDQILSGINSESETDSIIGNTVSNLYSTAYHNFLVGIRSFGSLNSFIQNNLVQKLTRYGELFNSFNYPYNLMGIFGEGGQHIIKSNEIRFLNDLSYDYPSLVGISIVGVTLSVPYLISQNFMHDFTMDSASSNSTSSGSIFGIAINNLANDTLVCANNVISLGGNVNNGILVVGIYEEGQPISTSPLNNYFFNTVNINGTVSGLYNYSTYSFYSLANALVSKNILNNSFVNDRSSSGGSGKNFAISLSSVANSVFDFNNYKASGMNGEIGYYSVDAPTLTDWQNTVGQDLNSLNLNPVYGNSNGSHDFDFIASTILPGTGTTGVTSDYYNSVRASIPQMGAFESTCLHQYIENTISICNGDSMFFYGNYFTQTGLYTAQFTNSQGCDSIIAINLVVRQLPMPVVSVNGFILTVQSFSQYQWQLNGTIIPGSTAMTDTAIVDGTYSVFVTDTNGCSATSDTVNIVGTKIPEYVFISSIIFPNPASNDVTISSPSPFKGNQLSFINSFGAIVKSIKLPDSQNLITISVEDLIPGIYSVEIERSTAILKTEKLVIIK